MGVGRVPGGAGENSWGPMWFPPPLLRVCGIKTNYRSRADTSNFTSNQSTSPRSHSNKSSHSSSPSPPPPHQSSHLHSDPPRTDPPPPPHPDPLPSSPRSTP